MKKNLSIFIASVLAFACSAGQAEDFRVRQLSSRVREFELDSIDHTSPLNYYLSRSWVSLSGRQRLWADISSSKFALDRNAPDEEVDDRLRDYILNERIECIVSYRDSAAAIVTRPDGEDFLLLNYCWVEDGRWVNGGQGMADDLDEAQKMLRVNLPQHYDNLPRIARIGNLPQDITPFVDFLAGVESSPEQFVMEMLGSHRLVVNGEYHRRKVSWDMLKRLVAMPEFPEKVGRVFMELPSWCQPAMDGVMASGTLDTGAIFDIFREEQPNGWWDRGEFEFICELWRINRSLPADRRIEVVLADYQIPYSKVSSREEREAEDRNTHMAGIIAEAVMSSDDGRGNLFLVGCAHAYKSQQAGIASAAHGQEAAKTAGAQLADRLGRNNVFTIFQHVLPSHNGGSGKYPIRGGIFDRAFELNGNRPVGFRLAGSPFGDEPFDGISEIKFNASTGSYADNFDGYLFLHPVDSEPKAAPLTEIFTDAFVDEMKRRASVMGYERAEWMWFGRTAPEMTRESVIEALLQE